MNNNVDDIQTYTVEEWVHEVSKQRKVVLPMIQRGSVWKPHQVLDLWDTMLQGMPLGAFMTSPIRERIMVFDLFTRKTHQAEAGAISLLDGQQRTLAILSAWPEIERKLQRRVAVWVDLGEDPPAEYKFRLWATTKAQPFGYERVNVGGQPLSKLSRAELRLANAAFSPLRQNPKDITELWDDAAFMPWRATFAVRLSMLLKEDQRDLLNKLTELLKEKINAVKCLKEKIENTETKESENSKVIIDRIESKLYELDKLLNQQSFRDRMQERAKTLQDALRQARSVRFPLISIGQFLKESSTNDGDPPIAVLFKRIATGGQRLSDEDYIFSVLKHQKPEVHNLVESLLEKKQIAALYTPNTLVMAGVRACLSDLRSDGMEDTKKLLNDSARIDKARFSRLSKIEEYDFSGRFQTLIGEQGNFAKVVEDLLAAIAYMPQFQQGLPLHALPWLVDRYLFDVLIAWYIKPGKNPADSRLSIVRFLLWGMLCIWDKAAASEHCIAKLADLDASASDFPERELMEALILGPKKLAYPLPSPESILKNHVARTPITTEEKVLRGQSRFLPVGDLTVEVYRRWWNLRPNRYEHPFLLWLQRDFVHTKFGEQEALAGTEEETPYDFDHIIPHSHWSGWTGVTSKNRLIDFFATSEGQKPDYWVLGNAIGNLRVWPSDENRQDGDASPAEKLKLRENTADTARLLSQSLINGCEQRDAWLKVSNDKNSSDKRIWYRDRAVAFQDAIELRTYDLYRSFYNDLDFASLDDLFQKALDQFEEEKVAH